MYVHAIVNHFICTCRVNLGRMLLMIVTQQWYMQGARGGIPTSTSIDPKMMTDIQIAVSRLMAKVTQLLGLHRFYTFHLLS